MKNFIAFRINPTFVIAPVVLEQLLSKNAFVSIGATQEKTTGFVDPLYRDNEAVQGQERKFVRLCGDAMVFALKIEKKSVPSSIIKQELKVRAAARELETGFAPGSKWKKDTKEEIIISNLPKCFPKSSELQGYLDLKNKLLIVGSGSPKAAEDLASVLRKEIEGLEPRFFAVTSRPGFQLTEWVRTGEVPDGFSVDMDGEMKHDAGGKIRFVNQNMTTAEVQAHIKAGYGITNLALTFDSEISFSATADFAFKKLTWLKIADDMQAEDKEQEFAAQMALQSADIARLVVALAQSYGGEQVPE